VPHGHQRPAPLLVGLHVRGPLRLLGQHEVHDPFHHVRVPLRHVDLPLAEQFDDVVAKLWQPEVGLARQRVIVRRLAQEPGAQFLRGHVDHLVEAVPGDLDVHGGTVLHCSLLSYVRRVWL
jgi:hypothetical protein